MRKVIRPKSHQMRGTGLSVATLIFMAACASPVPAPMEQMAVSRAAISNASSAGGSEFAPLQLKSAMNKMESAERAMVSEDFVLARQLAEQAQVDAQLAGATARTAKAQKAAEAVREDNRVLRQEIDRNAK